MKEKLKEIIEKVVPDLEAGEITENTRLIEDLEFDSLSMMMMLPIYR